MARHSVAEVLLDQGELVAAKQAEEEALAIKRKTGKARYRVRAFRPGKDRIRVRRSGGGGQAAQEALAMRVN